MEQISQVPQNLQPKSSSFPGLLLFFLGLLLGGGGVFTWQTGLINTLVNQPKACTMEAKICPDGSSVGRMPPNCEFAPCPSVKSNTVVPANWKTFTNSTLGYTVKYPDSLYEKPNSDDEFLIHFYPRSPVFGKYSEGIRINRYDGIGGEYSIHDMIYITLEDYLYTLQTRNEINIYKKTPIEVAGKKAYRYYSETEGVLSHYYNVNAAFKKDNNIYIITMYSPDKKDLTEKEEIFDKLISTFRFTDDLGTAASPAFDIIYCCEGVYTCPNGLDKNIYIENNAIHNLTIGGKDKNVIRGVCNQVGNGKPSTAVFTDKDCRQEIDQYTPFCTND